MSDNIVQVNQDSFQKTVLEAEKPVLVDFWAEWCGPCKMVAPVIDELAGEYKDKAGFAKINVDESPKLASQFGVMSIPTIMVFKNGKPQQQAIGFKSKNDLKKMLDGVIDK
jgi:thioredoxin 1